jgi:hypothetical protein
MKNNNFLMDSIHSSFEPINITSLESNSFTENENQFFSSSMEKNYLLDSISLELVDSISSEKSCFIDLNSSGAKVSSSLENNCISNISSIPKKESSSLENNLFISSNCSPINNSPLKDSSNSNEDTPEIKSIKIPERKHNKFAKDNIKRKIQVNYLKFLVNFINQIIRLLLCESANTDDIQFYRLDYKFAKDISKKTFNKLKKKTIGEIFKDNASSKFKNSKKLNVQVYNKVARKSKIIKSILDKPYLEFFYIYYSGQTIINLSDFDLDLDKTIDLSPETGFCKDLITKNNDTDISKEIYRKKILECINKHFLTETENIPIFLTNKY